MKNFILIIGFLVIILVTIVTTLPYFYNLNSYRDHFSEIISEKIDLKATVDGDIEFSILPIPSVELKDINIANIANTKNARLLYIQNTKIQFSILSLIKGDFNISKINLESPSLSYEVFKDGSNNISELINSNKLLKKTSKILFPDVINISNGFLSIVTPRNTKSIDYISASFIHNSINGPFEINGNFQKNQNEINFYGRLGSTKNDSEVLFELSSDNAFNIRGEGIYKPGNNFNANGKITGNIHSMKNLSEIIFEESSFIESEENGTINGNFISNKEGIKITDVILESESIKAKASANSIYSGSGNKKKLNWEYDLNFSLIDMDNLIKENTDTISNYSNVYYYKDYSSNPLSKFDFDTSPETSALFSLNIKEIIYKKDKIKNVNIDLDVFNRKIIINQLSAKLPGNSGLEVIGDIEHNGVRPQLKGKVIISGNNLRSTTNWFYANTSFIPDDKFTQYVISGDIDITPQKLFLNNFYAASDRTLVTGNLQADLSGSLNEIEGDILIDKLNMDEYNITQQAITSVSELLAKFDKNSTEQYWYKNIKYNAKIKFTAKDIVFNKENIKTFSFSSYIKPGVVNIGSYYFLSDSNQFSGNLFLNINSPKPKIKYSLLSQQLDLGLFEINYEQEENKSNNQSDNFWSSDKINFIGLRNFNGEYKFDIKKLKYKNQLLNNFIFSGNIEKQVLTIKQANFSMGEKENIKMEGKIGIGNNRSIALKYGVSKIPLLLIKDLFNIDHEITDGYLYSTGTFSSKGESPIEILKNQKLSSSYTIANLVLDGFSLRPIITKAPYLYSAIDMDTLIKNSISKGKTFIPVIKGKINGKGRLLQIKDSKIRTKYTTGGFASNIDLIAFVGNSLASFSFKPKSDAKPVTISYTLKGPINKPKITANYIQLENYITSKSNN